MKTDEILLKFELNGAYILVPAIRPEAVFGVSNLWLSLDTELARVEVEGKVWLVSGDYVKGLKGDVKPLASIPAMDLIGKYCREPVGGRKVPIMPADFDIPSKVSGPFMCIPSDNPYDWIALKIILENPEEVKFYGIDNSMLDDIQPVAFVKVPYMGAHPAKDVCEDMGIEDLDDGEKLNEAFDIIRDAELEKGVLVEGTGEYAGMGLEEGGEALVQDLKEKMLVIGL